MLDLSCATIETVAHLQAAIAALPRLRVLLFSDDGGVEESGKPYFVGMASHPTLEYVRFQHDVTAVNLQDCKALLVACPAVRVFDFTASWGPGECFIPLRNMATLPAARLTHVFGTLAQILPGHGHEPGHGHDDHHVINVLDDEAWNMYNDPPLPPPHLLDDNSGSEAGRLYKLNPVVTPLA